MSLQTLRLRTVLSFLLLSMSFCRCGQQQSGVNPGGGDSAFSQLSDAFLQGWLDWRPQAAVNLGFHQYDKGVTDYSKASLDAELKRLKEYSGKLEALDTATLSSHAFIDYRILRSAISNEIFNFENMKIYTQNPMTYAQAVDINTYVKRDFAPLEERVRSIIEVEKQIPAEGRHPDGCLSRR